MTPEDVKKLREAATPPPWFNTSQSGEITDAEGYYIGRATGAETRVGRANAKLWVSVHDMADLIERQAKVIEAADTLAEIMTEYSKYTDWFPQRAYDALTAYHAAREKLK